MNEAFDWASRSTCLRRAVGAVIVKGDRVVSQGYNGAVRNSRHCKELGCRREQLNVPSGERLESCRGVHAEENAIINAGRHGINVIGATLYCTTKPCSLCTKTIIQSGITRVVYDSGYGDELSEEMFNEVGINVERYSGVSPFSFKRFWGRKDKGFLEPIK
ncbi:MAG: dCMP deaminase family protein [Candidatus Pacearchaeota archaeon]